MSLYRQRGFVQFIPLIASAVGAASSLIGQQNANSAMGQAQLNNMAFNQSESDINRQYNSQEASIAREYAAGQAAEERRFGAEQAGINRDWSEQMSNTAHQREVQDLAAAGLNPILSAGKGGAVTPGAPTPTTGHASSAQAHATPASSSGIPNFGNPLASAVSAGVEAYKAGQEGLNSEQLRRMREPVAQLGDFGSQGLKMTKDAIGSFNESAYNLWSDAGGAASKFAESVSGTVASAVDTVKEAAKNLGMSARDIIEMPRKFVDEKVNSASSYVKDIRDRAAEQSEKSLHYGKSNFEGSKEDILKDISRIKDPVKRAQAKAAYREFLSRRR